VVVVSVGASIFEHLQPDELEIEIVVGLRPRARIVEGDALRIPDSKGAPSVPDVLAE
jgi:hypothetical protein